ncbi:hypothetical protein ACFL2K_00990 [Candidatus Margulisiibacteriota bacterium]
MKNKLLITLTAIIYIPVALIFCIVYGVFVGVIGTIIGTFEDWKKLVTGAYHEWKFFPKTAALSWWSVNNNVCEDRKKSEKERIIEEVKEGTRSGPHPISSVLVWTLYYVFLLIFRLIWAVLSGPFYAGMEAYYFFREKIMKREKIIQPETIDEDFERV